MFCNQVIGVSKGWNDRKNTGFTSLKFGDFSDISSEILEDIYNHSNKIRAPIPWKAGDFVLLDN